MTDLNGGLPDPAACPLLGLMADPATHFTFPHAGHRCHARRSPSTVELPHQARYCLTADFGRCDRYVARVGRPTEEAALQPTTQTAASAMAPLPAASAMAPLPAASAMAPLPAATAPGTTAVSAAAPVAPDWPPAPDDSRVAPADSRVAPADSRVAPPAEESPNTPAPPPDETPAAPAPLASWTLYPPDSDSPGIVRPRAPRTWRQTSPDPLRPEATAATPSSARTTLAVRLVRGTAVIVVLLLVLFVAAYLVAGSRLGLNAASQPSSSSTAAAVAPAAATSQRGPAATSAAASSTPAQSAGTSPRPSPSLTPTHTPRTTSTVHVVRSGETLQGIATEYGVTVQQIIVANKLNDPNVIVPGQRLVIPAPSRAP